MTRLKSSGGLMKFVNSGAKVIKYSITGNYKIMKQTTFERHNRKAMYYRNGEEVKPFDLIAVSYSHGLEFGIVRSTSGNSTLQYYKTSVWREDDPIPNSYDLYAMRLHFSNKGNPMVSYIHGNNDYKRIVKVTPDQLPKADQIIYNEMKKLIKEYLNKDLP